MKNRSGFVYILSALISLILVVFGGTLLLHSASESLIGQRSAMQAAAFQLAEAGVDQAAANLRTPTDLTDDVNAMTLPEGAFTVDSPPTQLASQQWQVRTHGVSTQDPAHSRNIEAVFQLTPESAFQFALFGSQAVNVSGSATTNSYDSRLGPYNDEADSPNYNLTHEGDVGTNRTTAGGVSVSGSIFIDGQVAVGPDVANPSTVVSGYNPAFITATPKVVSQPSAFPMPQVVLPLGLTCNDFTVKGNSTVTLAPGTYCYHNLTINGGGTLTASGSVTVYLTNQLTASGNSTLGVSTDPSQMQILMPSGASANLEEGTLTGSTVFYGALYGPQATLNITGNATVYGSVIAQTINVSGSADIHYDQALSTSSTVSNTNKTALISWREF